MIPQIIIYKETSDSRLSSIINDLSKPFSVTTTNGETLVSSFSNFKQPSNLPGLNKIAVTLQTCKKVIGNNSNNIIQTVLDIDVINHANVINSEVIYDTDLVVSSNSLIRTGTSLKQTADINTILYKIDGLNKSDSYIKAKDIKLTSNIPANVYNNTIIKDGLFEQFYYYFDSLSPQITGLLAVDNDSILYRISETNSFYKIYNYITNTALVPEWKSLILNGILQHTNLTNGILYKSELLWLPELTRCMIVSLKRSYKNDINSNQGNKTSLYDVLYQKYFMLEHYIYHGNYINCSIVLESTRNYLSDFHNTEKWHIT